jgi:hypothetical protein
MQAFYLCNRKRRAKDDRVAKKSIGDQVRQP